MTRRVVITGVGAVTPLGIGSDPLIDRWTAGEVGIADGFGRCLDFDPGDFLSKKEARRASFFERKSVGSKSRQRPKPSSIPDSPADQRSIRGSLPIPSGVTAPTPVMTTRRDIRPSRPPGR